MEIDTLGERMPTSLLHTRIRFRLPMHYAPHWRVYALLRATLEKMYTPDMCVYGNNPVTIRYRISVCRIIVASEYVDSVIYWQNILLTFLLPFSMRKRTWKRKRIA